jgi:hypothetical protein
MRASRVGTRPNAAAYKKGVHLITDESGLSQRDRQKARKYATSKWLLTRGFYEHPCRVIPKLINGRIYGKQLYRSGFRDNENPSQRPFRRLPAISEKRPFLRLLPTGGVS